MVEVDGSGQIVAEYVWSLLGPIARIDLQNPANTRYYVIDGLGHVRALVAPNGAITEAWHYDSWGNILSMPTQRIEQPFLWNGAYGYEYIPLTGLYHVGAREYDPRTARWLQRDPIGVAGGHPNVYLYCGNDPINAADPYGLWDWAKYFSDVGNVFVGYGQAIWGVLSSPFVIGQYYWENGVSWEATRQLFGGIWAGFCADWQAAWEGDAQAFGRAFGGVLITVGTAGAPFAKGSSASAKAPSAAGSTARNGLRQNAAAAGITIPAEAVKILQYLRNHNWTPPRGYKGGRVFQNKDGKLPACGNYREYDIHPYVKGQNRGTERIVVDINTGRAWYTPDHYQTFIEIRK